MKKMLLAATLVAIGSSVNAQQFAQSNEGATIQQGEAGTMKLNSASFRGAGTTSPFNLLKDSMRNGTTRTIVLDRAAPLDSGYVYGTNAVGDKGFASVYNLRIDGTAPIDSFINIVGVISKWSGRISTTSAKTVTFGVWSRGTDRTLVAGRTGLYVYGKPLALLGSQSAPATSLKTDGTFTTTNFSTTVANINASVYVGYTTAYTWAGLGADTFGLRSTSNAATIPNTYVFSGSDSLLTANNLVQNAAGTWRSVFDGAIGGGDMIIAPIVTFTCPTCAPTAINGVTHNNLTFFGSYPNPATNSTNVRFAVKNKVDVSITVLDATGKTINTINKIGLTTGEHTVNIETADFAAGNYIYMIRTSEGDVMASKFAVIK